ncbi:hypothetical protein PG984_011038 [Apiospora sp. TS-2023a]
MVPISHLDIFRVHHRLIQFHPLYASANVVLLVLGKGWSRWLDRALPAPFLVGLRGGGGSLAHLFIFLLVCQLFVTFRLVVRVAVGVHDTGLVVGILVVSRAGALEQLIVSFSSGCGAVLLAEFDILRVVYLHIILPLYRSAPKSKQMIDIPILLTSKSSIALT